MLKSTIITTEQDFKKKKNQNKKLQKHNFRTHF